MALKDLLSGLRGLLRRDNGPAAASRVRPPERLRLVHVPGHWPRNVVETRYTRSNISALRVGPVRVNVRFHPTEYEPYAMGAFVGDQRVGWLAQAPGPTDPHVEWLQILQAGGISRVVSGDCVRRNRTKRVVLFMPSDDKLSEVADHLLAGR